MAETQESPPAGKLTKEQRSQIAKAAATRRWAKAKQEKEKAQRARKPAPKAPVNHKRSGPREFSSALKMAEKRLAKAIQERAEAGAKYAVLSAEIPSLQRIIAALRNPMGIPPGYESAFQPPTLEQIVGDQPLGYQNPRRDIPSPPINLPPAAHPVTAAGRAMGGAIGVELQDEENENKFLETSPVAGGEWH